MGNNVRDLTFKLSDDDEAKLRRLANEKYNSNSKNALGKVVTDGLYILEAENTKDFEKIPGIKAINPFKKTKTKSKSK
ncbi:MAG: hypothetical protein V1777_04850 [Candidatus Micrarchaeota archaeon]